MDDTSPARRTHQYPLGTTTADLHDVIVREFRRACELRDRVGLAAILHPRVAALTDGGAPVAAGTRSSEGAEAVMDLVLTAVAQRDVALSEEAVNGEKGLVLRRSNQVVGIICVSVRGPLIRHVWIISAEERLRSWNRA
jgi:hypothetical protein